MTKKPFLSRWIPAACTLPSEQQPLRLAEFDALLASSLTSVSRSPSTLVFLLAGGSDVAAQAADLARRESECCSFFEFSVVQADAVELHITVPAEHTGVLDTLEARAKTLAAR